MVGYGLIGCVVRGFVMGSGNVLYCLVFRSLYCLVIVIIIMELIFNLKVI